MSESVGRYHFVFLVLLPFFFVAPELINLGFMFLRWDYLIIFVYVLFFLMDFRRNEKQTQFAWSIRTKILIGAYVACTFLMIWRLSSGSELIESVKYAAWPVKTIFWSVGFYLIARRLNGSASSIYQMLTSMAVLIFAFQIFELFSSSFRDFVFTYYPVAAEERLRDLTFRARGPFNGYDVTSLFFAVYCVYVNEYSKYYNIKILGFFCRMAIAFFGAFLSARTGLVLIVFYLGVSYFVRSQWLGRIGLIILLLFFVVFFSLLAAGDVAGDSSLLGRYLELVQAIVAGDILQISSFSGTFAMNLLLLNDGFNPVWGNGLTIDTTADQLYFKYFYMFGYIGLLIWIAINVLILYVCRLSGVSSDQKIYRNSAIWIIWIFILAHIKGGNYFFSTRLGDVVAVILLFSTLGISSERGSR